MTRNEAQARSLVASRARTCSIHLGDYLWLLTLEPASVSSPPPALASAWQIQADWGGARFFLELPESACVTWVARSMPELEINSLPDELAAAAVEIALSDVVTGLNRINKRRKIRITSLLRESTATKLPHTFVVTLRSDEDQTQVIRGVLRMDSLGLMMVTGLLGNYGAVENVLSDEDMRIVVRAVIGHTTLTAQALNDLNPHDVILMDESWLLESQDGGYELWLMANAESGLRVHWWDAQLTVLESWKKIMSSGEELDDDGDLIAENADEMPLDVQAVPVRLTFDLGQHVLTLAELKLLQPGQTFDLGHPISGAVRIRANGLLIGMGEMIEIDGHIGVAVLSLAKTQHE